MLALKGVDPSGWSLRRLLNAAEYQILASASDDKERAKLHAKLYAPAPGGPSRSSREGALAQRDRVGPWTRPVYSGVPDETGKIPEATSRATAAPSPETAAPGASGTNAGRSVADILALAALQDG